MKKTMTAAALSALLIFMIALCGCGREARLVKAAIADGRKEAVRIANGYLTGGTDARTASAEMTALCERCADDAAKEPLNAYLEGHRQREIDYTLFETQIRLLESCLQQLALQDVLLERGMVTEEDHAEAAAQIADRLRGQRNALAEYYKIAPALPAPAETNGEGETE